MKEEIISRYLAGESYRSISRSLGCSRSTISYHIRNENLQKPAYKNNLPKYDWSLIQKYYDEGHNIDECCLKFGCHQSTFSRAIKFGHIKVRPHVQPLANFLVENSKNSRHNVKRRLLKEGHLENKCSKCGQLPTWNSEPLVMVLDHKNGIRNDNRIENLRLLCPNCNSQTPTFCGKGIGTKPSKSAISTKKLLEALRTTASIEAAFASLGVEYVSDNHYAKVHKIANNLS